MRTYSRHITSICIALMILSCLVDVRHAWGQVPASSGNDYTLENGLQQGLRDAAALAGTLVQDLKDGMNIDDGLALLKTLAEDIRVDHLLILERLDIRDQEAANLGTEAAKRQQAVSEKYRATLDEILTQLDSLSSGDPALLDKLERIKDVIDGALHKTRHPILGALPYRHLGYDAQQPDESVNITPAYAGGNAAVSPDDMAGTPEAPVSQEIASFAQSLNWDPVNMYEWVKNNVETRWYRGCMKGAAETLRQRAGNDCDQAALLVALYRASGFPARFVRGTIEFPGIGKVRDLTGVQDPWKIAELFQHAGIPFEPVISGGGVSNFRVEHVWVEAYIPYSNYRGALMDEHGKTWLPLDTSVKVADHINNDGADIYGGLDLSQLRVAYLSNTQATTPLEYLRGHVDAYLAQALPGTIYNGVLSSRSLPAEHMGIIPAALQYTVVNVSNEYTAVPDDLLHKIRFTASDTSGTQLFTITYNASDLSGKSIALSYEPETVEDQEIINSYGGLMRTPAYLVRLRPVLRVGGERVAVATDGVPMGGDYTLGIDIITPGGTQTVSSVHIAGNLSVIGVVSGSAGEPEAVPDTEKDAERLLHERAMAYLASWDRGEDELSRLLRVAVAHPAPSVVTVGGLVDVTYLLDEPHGFEWRGVYLDAGFRPVEAVPATAQSGQEPRVRDFMALSAMEGSAQEDRVFEEGFGVESISAAKLMGIAADAGIQMMSVDGSNVSTINALPLPPEVRADIAAAVQNGHVVTVPVQLLTYEDWTGVGYIKEDPATGESGYMLTGMTAGGMTVWGVDRWSPLLIDILQRTNEANPETTGALGYKIYKLNSTDLQVGNTGEPLKSALAVYVSDSESQPVKGLKVTFIVRAGGGNLGEGGNTMTAVTDSNGIASVKYTLGQRTSDNPVYWQEEGKKYPLQVGENIVDVFVDTGLDKIWIPRPFTAFGKPGVPDKEKMELVGDGQQGYVLTFPGFISLTVRDKYGNPVANEAVIYEAKQAEIENNICSYDLTRDDARILLWHQKWACDKFLEWGVCGVDKAAVVSDTQGVTDIQTRLGGIPGARYPVVAFLENYSSLTFTLNNYTYQFMSDGEPVCPGEHEPVIMPILAYTYQTDNYGHAITAGAPGSEFLARANLYVLREGTTYEADPLACGEANIPCMQVIGNGRFTLSTDYLESTVTFNGESGTEVSGTVPRMFEHEILLQTGLNNINIAAKVKVEKTVSVRDCSGCSIETQSVTSPQVSTVMKTYGVAIEINHPSLAVVDDRGYLKNDLAIVFDINPLEYKAWRTEVIVYADGAPLAYLTPLENDIQPQVTLLEGFQFKDYETANYEVEVILNEGTAAEIRSERVPIRIISFSIVKPSSEDKFIITNDENGDPQMPTLLPEGEPRGFKVEVALKGATVTQEMRDNLEVCWDANVEYIVKSKYRQRKGLQDGGTDGFVLQGSCLEQSGPTFKVDWGDNFGGGVLKLNVHTTLYGVELNDTFSGTIEGQTLEEDTNFKPAIIAYLENPASDQETPTLRSEVGLNKIFRVIAFIETKYKHFYPSVYGIPKQAIYPRENTYDGGDGGLGIMQLTIPKATYKQAWNYKENIDEAVGHLRANLNTAKAYPEAVKNDPDGCTGEPVLINNKWSAPCRPMAPYVQDEEVKSFSAFKLRMDMLSLYNANWHYWRWDDENNKWLVYISSHPAQIRGRNYANNAEGIVNAILNSQPTPTGF